MLRRNRLINYFHVLTPPTALLMVSGSPARVCLRFRDSVAAGNYNEGLKFDSNMRFQSSETSDRIKEENVLCAGRNFFCVCVRAVYFLIFYVFFFSLASLFATFLFHSPYLCSSLIFLGFLIFPPALQKSLSSVCPMRWCSLSWTWWKTWEWR